MPGLLLAFTLPFSSSAPYASGNAAGIHFQAKHTIRPILAGPLCGLEVFLWRTLRFSRMAQERISSYSDTFHFDWSQFAPRQGLVCLPAIVIVILGSVLLQHPGVATVAGGGAVSVGFGSFQRIKNSELWPMLLASVGMFISTLVGTVAGYSPFVLMLVAGIWGFSYGMLSAIDGGIAWAGLQCVITMLVASGYPQTFRHALLRALSTA